MEAILEKANELGLLIRGTDAFKEFAAASGKVESDTDAATMLKKYNELADTIRLRQESGYALEQFETDRFREITASVASNHTLREYLASRDRYMDMLMKIYHEIDLNAGS